MTLARAWNLGVDALMIVLSISGLLLALSAIPPWLGVFGIGKQPTPTGLISAFIRVIIGAILILFRDGIRRFKDR